MNADTEIVDLLRRLVTAVERLAPVETSPADGLAPADEAALAELLPAISLAIGNFVFSVGDLQIEAKSDDELEAALAGLNGRQLGRLLARGCGHKIAGCHIERAGEARDGVLWRVVR